MRFVVAVLLVGSVLTAGAVSAQQSGPANLCQELLAFAEKEASKPKETENKQQEPIARTDNRSPGTQGGGSTNSTSSSGTASQKDAAPTAPVSSGAAPEASTSGHSTDQSSEPGGPNDLGGGVSVQQVRDVAGRGDRQACRDTAQKMRRAGAEMPAALIALAAYEPPKSP